MIQLYPKTLFFERDAFNRIRDKRENGQGKNEKVKKRGKQEKKSKEKGKANRKRRRRGKATLLIINREQMVTHERNDLSTRH